MKERIKAIRREKNLTQVEFGEQIHVKGNTVAGYEKGIRIPSEATIANICTKFDVNEEWLRTGKEPMHPVRTEKQELARLVEKAMQEADPDTQAMLAVLLRATPEERRIIREKAEELLTAYQAITAKAAMAEHQRVSAIARQRADEAEAALKETQATTKARA